MHGICIHGIPEISSQYCEGLVYLFCKLYTTTQHSNLAPPMQTLIHTPAHSPLKRTTQLKASLSILCSPLPARASMVRGGWVARVLRQDNRLMAMWEREVWASLDRGRLIEVLRIVPEESVWIWYIVLSTRLDDNNNKITWFREHGAWEEFCLWTNSWQTWYLI